MGIYVFLAVVVAVLLKSEIFSLSLLLVGAIWAVFKLFEAMDNHKYFN